jgi:hypothetical protein
MSLIRYCNGPWLRSIAARHWCLRTNGRHDVHRCRSALRHRNKKWRCKKDPMKGGTMNRPAQSPDKVSDQLHRLIHIAAAGLLIWLVVAAWLLFGGTGYIELILAMISVFAFMALAIPAALWRASVTAWRSNTSANATEPADTGEASETVGTWLQANSLPGRTRKKVRRRLSRSCCQSRLWQLASRPWALCSN